MRPVRPEAWTAARQSCLVSLWCLGWPGRPGKGPEEVLPEARQQPTGMSHLPQPCPQRPSPHSHLLTSLLTFCSLQLGTQDYLFMEGDIMGLSTTTLSCHLPGNVACHYQSSCRPRLDESSLDGGLSILTLRLSTN